MRKTEGREGDLLDNCCVCSRDSLHVLFDELAMVILDLLVTVPVEVKSVHMVVGRVGRAALLECDLGRWRRDVFVPVLVVGGGGHVVASEDATGEKDSVGGAKEEALWLVKEVSMIGVQAVEAGCIQR
jgi:hypothetical protein